MLEALVTVHDSSLIAECESSRRFGALPRRYVFVGPRPVEVAPGVRYAVARDYDPNFEQWPHFYDFTGWFVLAHHLASLLPARFATLQYDMVVPDPVELAARAEPLLDAGGPVAFVAGHNSAHNWMLLIPGFPDWFASGMFVKGVDPGQFPPFEEWPSTQGMLWRREDFVEFMEWFTPLFPVWADNPYCGHLAERSVWAWMMTTGRPASFLPGLVAHEGRDVHGTCALMGGRADVHAERAATFGK